MHPPHDPEPDHSVSKRSPSDRAEVESPWVAAARNTALVLVVLGMVWLVFNVDLPPAEELQTTIDGFGWAAWFIFVGLYALVATTPIPVTIMAMTGGFLFGTVLGSVLSVAGAFLGCWAAYWLARALGEPTVKRMLGRYRARVEHHLTSAGFEAVCTLRLMPGVPYWPVNYGSGAFGVPHHVYLPATFLSIIPGQISLVALGGFVAEPGVMTGAVVVIAWAVVLTLTLLAYRRWRTAHHNGGRV
ncbi:TVP38/TMEM64 family protein [Nesterenkonia alba]|uniref:TVP38/TMEM64 family protein n=1 Tax=Nesterenkonia alba TaxID=515814 RepID=UPI0003B6EF1A|nr:TVP38/TMEM64 family protein [Nesterenkonia alba]